MGLFYTYTILYVNIKSYECIYFYTYIYIVLHKIKQIYIILHLHLHRIQILNHLQTKHWQQPGLCRALVTFFIPSSYSKPILLSKCGPNWFSHLNLFSQEFDPNFGFFLLATFHFAFTHIFHYQICQIKFLQVL